ncbi:ABC transporter substrate-binding protein [Candidatus Fermentibacteria bacterium]|nr:ABC transporter substrate-binding protein [Candidatus Fermentibacteria bacterium]
MQRNILALIMALFVFCSGRAASEEEPVRIGVVLPMSPPGAYASGNPMWWAVQQAVDEVNARGGILGREVEAVLGDTRGVPEEARAVTERLITRDRVVGVVGNYHSSCALAALDLFRDHHVPYIAAEPWADDVTALGYEEVFRISVTNSLYRDITVDWMISSGFESIAAVQEITDWGLGVNEKLTQAWNEAGIRNETAFTDVKTEDFTGTLLRFTQWSPPPDMLFGSITGPGAYRIIKQAYDIGLAPSPQTVFYATNECLHPEVWEVAGEAARYITVTQIGLPPFAHNMVTRQENARFEQEHDRTMNATVMEAYDSFMLMCEAIEDAGCAHPDSIIRALENIEWKGMRGTYTFPYGTDNPVPEDQPDYMWHQWPDVTLYLFQYTEVGQSPEEGTVIWPPEWSQLPEGQYYVPVPE